MAIYVPSRKRLTVQPRELTDLNPFWMQNGLLAAYNGYSRVHYGCSTEMKSYANSNYSVAASARLGIGRGRNGSDNLNILRKSIASSDSFTVINGFRVANVATNTQAANIGISNSGSNFYITSCTDAATAGKCGFRILIASTNQMVGGSTTVPVNSDIIVAARHIYNTEQAFYLEGVKDAATGAYSGSLGTMTHFACDNTYNNRSFFAAVFNKALPDDLIVELSNNPWQIFKPSRSWFYLGDSTLRIPFTNSSGSTDNINLEAGNTVRFIKSDSYTSNIPATTE